MASSSATCSNYFLPSFTLSRKIPKPSLCRTTLSVKGRPISIKASSTSLNYYLPPLSGGKQHLPTKANNWQWKFKDNIINIYYEEYERSRNDCAKNIIMIPTISDVSTVEEWRSVARDIVGRYGKVDFRATIVDWPGLGYSDRPKMEYDADVMEKFIVDFINAPDSPVGNSGNKNILPMS